ncbi:hypothetical protein M2972_18540, partial [Klebsiella pneumoniae]|nr:hypothetical protein [Klebsiella pneumoniae]
HIRLLAQVSGSLADEDIIAKLQIDISKLVLSIGVFSF